MIRTVLERAKPPTTRPVAAPTAEAWGPLPWRIGDPYPDVFDPLMYVSEDAVLDLAVVAAFLQTTCSLLTQMPLGAYVGADQVRTPPILTNPAPGGNRTFADFACEFFRDVALYGNFLAILGDPGGTGWPTVLYPVPFSQWSLDDNGNYRVGADVYRPDETFHVRRNCCTGEMVGRGLMQTHRRLLGSCVAAERWASTYFDGGAVPPFVYKRGDTEITQEQADRLKFRLLALLRRREPAVIRGNDDIVALNVDADKAQMTESRRWNSHQLAVCLGFPPALVGLESPSMTYQNVETVAQQYVTTTVMSYLRPMEEQFTLQCLPRGYVARFDLSAILRPNLAERVDLAVKGLGGGVYTVDEARELVDLPPATEAAPGLDVSEPALALVEEVMA